MKTYFTNKLDQVNKEIERSKNNVIKYASELDINNLINSTSQLQQYKEKLRELSRECAEYLTVEEVVSIIKGNKASVYDVCYCYQYTKPITLAEREALVKIHIIFKNAKIKS